jgi:DHA1 family multidrug resistance protein-like MFS transporter
VLRESRALSSAVLLRGTGEVVDFLLPLFAGAALDASPTAIGVLLAVELAVSLVARPITGALADRFERRTLAAAGALLYAVACAGYALAGTLAIAYLAAAVGGAGGALLWVSLRALVGERLPEDSGVFARLVAAEEFGGWVVFVPAVIAVGIIGYPGTFLALAGVSLAGAGYLMATPRRAVQPVGPVGAVRKGLLRKLFPMLAAVVVTMTAEGTVSLLLLLHLQNAFDLAPLDIATVFLPGSVAMSVLPPYLHRWVVEFGRTRMLAAASAASALFAASLAFAPNPVVIAICWVLAGAAWAIVLPVQQAIIAEAAGQSHLGRGLGRYESATLLGALIGSVAAGLLYDGGSWALGCLAAAAVILAGALFVPAAVRRLGVPDKPVPPRESDKPAPPRAPDKPPPRAPDKPASPPRAPEPAAALDRPATGVPALKRRSRRRLLADLAGHASCFVIALLIAGAVVTDLPLAGILGVGETINPFRPERTMSSIVAAGLRLWWIVLVVDTVWTLAKTVRR